MAKIFINNNPRFAGPGKDETWLQGIGFAKGKPASKLKIGDIMIWNYGSTSEVIKIVKETPKFITVREKFGKHFSERRFKKSRIVAIAN